MKNLAYILLATIAFGSCNRSDEGLQRGDNGLHEIVVSPSVKHEKATRGSIVDNTKELQTRNFKLYATAYDNDTSSDYAVAKATMEHNATEGWRPTEGHKIYWPTSESDVTFYAWHPATLAPRYYAHKQIGIDCNTSAAATPSGGAITLYKEGEDIVHHDASGTAGLQEDLMYCIKTMKNPTQQSVDGGAPDYTVDLEFMHLLTALRFEYKTADGVQVRIKGMTLHNVKNVGRFVQYYDTNGDKQLAWDSYSDFDFNPYPETRPNYHCVPMKWNDASYVSAPTNAVAIGGENDLMVFPQVVEAWQPNDGTYQYSIAANDAGAMRGYLQIYCDIKNSKGEIKVGNDMITITNESMAIDPNNCIYVPIGSKNVTTGEELWKAGNIVTYTLTFGSGYDKDGNKNDDLTDTTVAVEVTVTLNDWVSGGDFDVEF